jgi:hypothetical protein
MDPCHVPIHVNVGMRRYIGQRAHVFKVSYLTPEGASIDPVSCGISSPTWVFTPDVKVYTWEEPYGFTFALYREDEVSSSQRVDVVVEHDGSVFRAHETFELD